MQDSSSGPAKPVQAELERDLQKSLRNTCDMYSWGSNNWEQLGVPGVLFRDVPIVVQDLLGKGIKQVACGSEHTLAITGTIVSLFFNTEVLMQHLESYMHGDVAAPEDLEMGHTSLYHLPNGLLCAIQAMEAQLHSNISLVATCIALACQVCVANSSIHLGFTTLCRQWSCIHMGLWYFGTAWAWN